MKLATKIRIVVLLVLVAALELMCRTGVIPRVTMISPSEMVTGVIHLLWSGHINNEISATLGGILMATVASICIGFVLGTVLHALPRVRDSIDPLLATYYSVPTYVFYPMLLVFFGMNRTPIVVIGFMFAVVAMMTGTLNGLDRVPPVMLKTARIMGMHPISTVLRIVLPWAAPYIFSGVKLAIAYSFVGVLGAEFILSNSGVGHQIGMAFNNFDSVEMYSLILFIVVVVSSVNAALLAWERLLQRRRGLS